MNDRILQRRQRMTYGWSTDAQLSEVIQILFVYKKKLL